jgi:hypothetical protein
MVDAPHNGRNDPLPDGLMEELSSTDGDQIRPDEVARARRQAVARAFDDRHVCEEIASQMLHLSDAR